MISEREPIYFWSGRGDWRKGAGNFEKYRGVIGVQ